jgi:hypothetical protein
MTAAFDQRADVEQQVIAGADAGGKVLLNLLLGERDIVYRGKAQ